MRFNVPLTKIIRSCKVAGLHQAYQMMVIPEKRRAHYIWYLRFYYEIIRSCKVAGLHQAYQMMVIPEKRRAHYIWYLRFYYEIIRSCKVAGLHQIFKDYIYITFNIIWMLRTFIMNICYITGGKCATIELHAN